VRGAGTAADSMTAAKRDDFVLESSSRFNFLLEHGLLRKPVLTPHQVRGRLFRIML
jgi:hypothetical protein